MTDVPAETTVPAFTSLVAQRGSSVLDTADGALISAEELHSRARRAAGGLHRLGLRGGDRIALLLPNSTDWFVAHFAAAELGLLTVPLNTRYRRAEIAELMRTSGCRALVVDPDFRDLGFAELVHDLVHIDEVPLDVLVTTGPSEDLAPGGIPLRQLLAGPAIRRCAADVADGTPLVVFGTSGTTSAPKLAIHTHSGVVRHAENVATGFGLGPDDVVLGLLPPCGAYGYTVALAALAAGARLVLLPTFAPTALPDVIERYGVTFLAATEAILRPALAAPDALTKLRTWRLGATAGGSVADIVTTLDAAGTRLVNVYGASELLALFAFRDPAADPVARSVPGGTLAGPGLEVRAVSPETGTVLALGHEGELQFRGYCAFIGYLGNPAASDAARTEDGCDRSGDHGRVAADGRSFDYLSRMAHTMRLKGFLVDPAQIEEVLIAHPGVTEAQVVGVPQPGTGEDAAVAFVVLAAGARGSIGPEDLLAWCRERLATFKVPARVAVVDAIPTTPSANGDKALKRALRAQAAQILAEPS